MGGNSGGKLLPGTHPKGPQARKRAVKNDKRKRPPARPGEEERIVLRRLAVMRGRTGGLSMREIATKLGVSVGLVHEDAQGELAAARGTTRAETHDWRDMELRMDRALVALQPVLEGRDRALRVRAALAWVRISVQRARLLGLYQQEGATDTAPQDFLEFLEEFWRRRRIGELGEGERIIDIVPKDPKKIH